MRLVAADIDLPVQDRSKRCSNVNGSEAPKAILAGESTSQQRRFMAAPSYHEVVELKEFNPARTTDKLASGDRFGAFTKALAYEGWRRSLFPLEWFDSRPERTAANTVDDDEGVTCWVRLHIGELPILWNSAGQEYNPDLIVTEKSGAHWVVEVKMDKEMASADVVGKRKAAKRWANYVTADETVGVPWRYLLVSESDVETAKGSWPAQEARRRVGSSGTQRPGGSCAHTMEAWCRLEGCG